MVVSTDCLGYLQFCLWMGVYVNGTPCIFELGILTLRVRIKGGGTSAFFHFSSPPPLLKVIGFFGVVKNIVKLSKLKNKLIFTLPLGFINF